MPIRSQTFFVVCAATLALLTSACSSDTDTDAEGSNASAVSGVDTNATYEAADGESCIELGLYDFEAHMDEGNPKDCMLGAMVMGVFNSGKPLPVQDKDVSKETCEGEGCQISGTRCNWNKEMLADQSDSKTYPSKHATTKGVKVFSKTTFAFTGSEHHMNADGTDLSPKCSWTIIGKKH